MNNSVVVFQYKKENYCFSSFFITFTIVPATFFFFDGNNHYYILFVGPMKKIFTFVHVSTLQISKLVFKYKFEKEFKG